MNDKVLLVDDEPNVLEGLQRQLRKKFQVTTANGGEEGLKAIGGEEPFAVIVSDLRMPGMDGVRFLAEARQCAPDSVRMILSGHADLDAAINAVNEGNVFRFLTKPCEPKTLISILEAGVQQYQLVTAEKDLIEKTLSGSIKLLTDILSHLSPVAFGRASRVRRIMGKLASQVSAERSWEFELAGMLSQTGCVTIPTETVEKIYHGKPVSLVESHMFERHPQIGCELIMNIPRLEGVAEMIAYQNKHFNGEGFPQDDRKGEDQPFGSRALHVALDFDTLVSGDMKAREALDEMKYHAEWYDPIFIEALAAFIKTEATYLPRSISVFDLITGMILAENVATTTGLLVIAKGQEITPSVKERLMNFNRTVGIVEPVDVLVPVKES